ncbi:MAG: tetratricopeptide (TPR) repeat protein [Pseudohongiellaceae bacterium]|jgi:tetratricopeptide (TPR) repeat protein
MIWCVLALWWIVYPNLIGTVGPIWSVHLLVVAAFGLALAPRLWRTGSLRCGPPAVLTGVALLSLGCATWLARPDDLPLAERYWAGLTGLAHAVFFLCAAAVVPLRTLRSDSSLERWHDEVVPARRLRHILSALLLGMVLMQFVTMIRQAGVDVRPGGTLGNPNTLGALIAAIGLALAGFLRWRPVILVPLASFVVFLAMTSSRGAMAAAAAMILLLAARRSWRTVIILSVTLGVLLVMVPNPLWDRVLALRSEDHYSRLFLWKVALTNIAENPLGIGASMNKYVFQPLALDPDFPWLLHQRRAVGLTHNVLLTVFLEWGWLAGAAMVSLGAWAGLRLSPRPRRPAPPAGPVLTVIGPQPRRDFDALGQGAILGAGVLLLELQVDGLEQNALVFSVFLVLAAVSWQRAREKAPSFAVAARPVALALVAISLFLGYEGVRRGRMLKAQSDTGAAISAWISQKGELSVARAELQRLQAIAPKEPSTHLRAWQLNNRIVRLAGLSGGQGDEAVLEAIARGTEAIETVCRLNPSDSEHWRKLADWRMRLWRLTGNPPHLLLGYVEAMEQLLAVDPLDVRARWDMAREYQRAGRWDLFEDQLDTLFEIEPDDAHAWFVLGRFHILAGRSEQALYAMCRAREAVFNCRVKLAADSPRSHAYYTRVLGQVDVNQVRRAIHELREELLQ